MLKTHIIRDDDYKLIVCGKDPDIDFFSYIAVHNTNLGPALGGCRCLNYKSGESLRDAKRLSEAMTYKNSICGNDLGGGKAVFHGPKTNEKLIALGHFLNDVNNMLGENKYYMAEDVGTSVDDIKLVASVSKYVAGMYDPSPWTAQGVMLGIQAALKFQLGGDFVAGVHIVVEGLGKVGYELCKLLHEKGYTISVSDIDKYKVRKVVNEFGATEIEQAHIIPCDVYAPCALGNTVTLKTIKNMGCLIIAGSANNQLDEFSTADILLEENILYAPDYLINAGGVISTAEELTDREYNLINVSERVKQIPEKLLQIFKESKKTNKSTVSIADRIAKGRIYG